jgi:hypothetical protein
MRWGVGLGLAALFWAVRAFWYGIHGEVELAGFDASMALLAATTWVAVTWRRRP